MILIFEKWNNYVKMVELLFSFFRILVEKICKNAVLLFVAFIYYKNMIFSGCICVERMCSVRA